MNPNPRRRGRSEPGAGPCVSLNRKGGRDATRRAIPAALALLAGQAARAGDVEILAAEARAESPGVWSFDVTLRHADEGWDHYADAWEVRSDGGAVLGRRTLLHPHADEQPFTRSLAGVTIPDGVERVVIVAHDTVHGWGPAPFALDLPR